MKHKYVISVDGKGVDEMLKGVQEYRKWLVRKTDELAKRLADKGYEFSYQVLSNHVYSGQTLASLTVERVGPARYVVKAESEAILFLEFGAGVIGYGHPEPQGYGPGTYPGQTHALDPNGWWFETDDPNLAIRTSKKTGKMYGHSYGTPAYMPMYSSVKALEMEFKAIAQEVFSN